MKKALKKINSLSLYWKTWTITTLTILITVGLFFLIFSFFASKILEQNQQKKFDRQADIILEEIKKNGFDSSLVETNIAEGYNIIISKDSQIITSSIIFFSNQDEIEDSSMVTTYTFEEENNSVLTRNETINFNNVDYDVSIIYPVAVNQKDITSALYSMFPYLIILGLIVSLLVSRIYARYFSTKITHINDTIFQMSTRSISETYIEKEGDELQTLENSVHHMYQELQATLVQLNKEMISVKQLEEDRQLFMRGATHELKTPIMTMTTILEGMMSDIAEYDNQDYYLQICYEKLQNMSHLVNEMLEVSRIQSVMYSGEMNLKEGTEEVLDIYTYMIQDKEILVNKKYLEKSTIKIPERNLLKVLSNLIGNSVKYTPEHGIIHLIVDKDKWQIKNQIDNMDQIKDKNIFAPFVSYEKNDNEDSEKGHGLGLYIVDAILNQYGYTYHWEINEHEKEFIFTINLV